jgi:hypothetical protein
VNQLHVHILQARAMIERGKFVDAQNFLLSVQGASYRVKEVDEAMVGLTTLYYSLLNAGDWTGAALFRWGKNLFNPDPRSVRLIWRALTDPTKNKILIMGCGSSGKTYSTSGWVVLNWSRDPQYTSGKIVSTTAGHAKSNIMARIKTFHANSIFKFPGEPVAGGLMFPGLDTSASVLAIAIPEGESGEGRLTGFHPYPRSEPHPVFGDLSRGFVVIDEADAVAEGLWAGVDNVLSNEDYSGSVKVVALTNPRLKHNSFAHRAEPPDGWSALDEDAEEWTSRDGWHVISIDAAKSENVIQKKVIFPGLMTYHGYMNYVRKGKSDPNYWTYARGKYPPDTVDSFNVFSPSSFDDSVGRLMFEGEVTPIGSLDPAFAEGGDDATLTIGRFGKAIGFTNARDQFIQYPRVRLSLQIENQINVMKNKTPIMAESVIKILRSFGIRPEWFCMDKTGVGFGLHDNIAFRFGKILGIQWGAKATEMKILQEDTEVAAEKFKGIAAELWFAANSWVDGGYVKFSPTFEGFRALKEELTLRRWQFAQVLQKLEDKSTFKSSNQGRSCDRGDSFVMIVHPIRKYSQGLPTLITGKTVLPVSGLWQGDDSVVDREIPWVTDDKLFT